MSLTGTLNTTLSGLQVTQQALQIVGSNVANAQTPGYVRKTLEQISVAAASSIGVRTTSINRSLDTIIQTQLRQETSGGSYADKLSELYQQMQTLYGAPGSSSAIDTLFSNFTTAMQALGTSPNSSSAQSSAVNSAQLLAQQLNSLSNNIQGMRSASEQGIAADVQAANSALQQIAKINLQISTATSIDPTTATLMDQRDRYIDQLSSLMDIRVVQGQFNQVSVFTGSGIQLVGNQAATLTFNAQGTLTPNSQYSVDPTKSGVGTITMTSPTGSSMDLIAAGAVKSGEIAAYLQMRDQILPQAQTQLDELAAQMSQAASDLTTPGDPYPPSPAVSTGFSVDTSTLQSGNVIHLTYTDSSNVSHNVSIVRVDDPSVLPLPDTTTANSKDTVWGVDFSHGMASVVSQLNAKFGVAGLQFSNAGNTLRVVKAPGPIASVDALSQTATQASLTTGNPQLPLFLDGTGLYTGAITAYGSQKVGLAQRVVINGALISNPGGLVNYSNTTLAGDSTRPDFLYNQMTAASLTYSPATGLGGASNPMQGTLTSFIGQVMTQQGQNAANASSLKQGQDVVVNSLKQRMSNISDVNIDTEMANLLTLQNAYAANARVFSTVQQMFQSLLQM
jgi:flagellar hook-associated protein 1